MFSWATKRISILFITMVAAAFCSQAWAVGGVTFQSAEPHFATAANQADFEDMRVKVLGGSVRMTRRWVGDQWEWNSRWNDLGVNYPNPNGTGPVLGSGSTGSSGGGNTTPITDPYFSSFVVRNGQYYVRDALPVDNRTYENSLVRTLKQHSDKSWTWSDRQGNRIYYNKYGQMTHYTDRNGVTVRVNRNTAGNITQVLDHHNNVVITITWENVPGAEQQKNKQGDDVYPQRPVRLEDHTGRTVVYHWNANNQLETVNDVQNESWTYRYNGSGHLTGQTDPMDRLTTFSITANGELRSHFNADGVGASYRQSYDENKKEFYVSITDGTGRVTERWYNDHGMEIRRDLDGETQFTAEVVLSDNSLGTNRLVQRYSSNKVGGRSGGGANRGSVPPPEPVYVKSQTITDARGNQTRYEYDMWKNITRVVHPDGSMVSTTYNVNFSLPTRIVDERGVITEYEYDSNGNLLTLVEAKGTAVERTTRFTYDEYGQLKTKTTGESAAGTTALATTRWDYDAYGNVTKLTDPLEYATHFNDFDALGNAHSVTDADSNIWRYSYDPAGNLLSAKNPYDQGDSYTYNKAGDLESHTAANGSTTTIETNASGLPLEISDAEANISNLEYDRGNRLTSTIDANRNAIHMAYDAQARIHSTTDGEGNVIEFEYEGGQLGKIQYPTFHEHFEYDSRVRVSASHQYANNRTYSRRFGYDLGSNIAESIDANQNEDQYEHDELNRLVRAIDAAGGITEFQYDARDNLLQVTDPEGRITAYTYTLRDELQTETKHDYIGTTKQFVFVYNPNGSLQSRRTPENEYTEYQYDDANRLVEMHLFAQQGDAEPIKRVVYHYNDFDQNTGYTQEPGRGEGATPDILALSESYTYNVLGQLESVTVDFGPFQKSYSYTYYPNGLNKTYTNPEGITYTYYYTKHDELAAVQIPGEGQIGFTDFYWQVPQTILLPGGTKIKINYDQFLQVEERLLEDPASTELAQALYEYDLENNITQITERFGSLVFDYDSLYRLTKAEYPWEASDYPSLSSGEQFDYDGVGNRTVYRKDQSSDELVLSYNDHNQLVGSSDGAVFSYNASGHTVRKYHNGQTTDYIYNREERLIEVKINGSTVGEYSYNPYGQRIRKIANGQAIWFLYNDEGLAAEYDGSGNLIKEYHFKPYGPWMTEPLFQRAADGGVYYYQNDHLGTPQRMVDKSGAVVWEARYEAFGKAEVLKEQVGNNLRFPGQYFDQETGLHHNYFRDYDSELGRYVQSDPLGLYSALNLYTYGYANPLLYSDPTGEFVPLVVGALIGAGLEYLTNPCASTTDILLAAALGAVGGGISKTVFLRFGPRSLTRVTGKEWSHSIPRKVVNQYTKPKSWLRKKLNERNGLNGSWRTPKWHYKHDPSRYPSGWRGFGDRLPPVIRQLDLVPDWLKGAIAAGAAGSGIAGCNAEC